MLSWTRFNASSVTKERPLHRGVVSPKSHGTASRIIGAAGLGKRQCRQSERTVLAVGQRVSHLQVVHLDEHDDIAGRRAVERLLGTPLHAEEVADLERFARSRILHRTFFGDLAGEDPHIAHPRDERVDAGLEHLRNERAVDFRFGTRPSIGTSLF